MFVPEINWKRIPRRYYRLILSPQLRKKLAGEIALKLLNRSDEHIPLARPGGPKRLRGTGGRGKIRTSS